MLNKLKNELASFMYFLTFILGMIITALPFIACVGIIKMAWFS